MRLISYWQNGVLRPGFEEHGRVVDAASVHRFDGEPTTRALLMAGSEPLAQAANRARQALQADGAGLAVLSDLRLGPPVPDPDKIICMGFNYAKHASELSEPIPPAPNLFAKFRNCLVGPTDSVILPTESQEVDYEGELAVVIGTRCRNVTEANALRYVAGYAAFNDVSARDLQFRTSQFTAGKALDTFAPMGPGIMLAEEVGDPQALRVRTRVNGEMVQDGATADMVFSVAATISFISRLMTLEPGDVIATGTPFGVGYKRVPPAYLHSGDTVEVDIERVGSIRNTFVATGLG
jgi:2-keto-4-pentenoate hydratase/2-oxohepta-3-ene-1,7-dioic acid hydratase in catechol pathway